MEILLPLPSLSTSDPDSTSATTVLVNHVVAAEKREAFLTSLQDLLKNFHAAPGAKGCMVFQHQEGDFVRFTILQRFASPADHEAWVKTGDFARWQAAVEPLKPVLEHVRSYHGMEALFAAGQSPDAPPRWKMALLLLIGVFPLSLAMSAWCGPALASISPLTGALITSPLMVGLMTYVVVPLLTKIFAGWLQMRTTSGV